MGEKECCTAVEKYVGPVKTPWVDFLYVFRARFLYESAFYCQNITREKHV